MATMQRESWCEADGTGWEDNEKSLASNASGDWPLNFSFPRQEPMMEFKPKILVGSSYSHRLGLHVRAVKKIMIPKQEYECCNLIGRILGPNGVTVRKIGMDTGCRILIRGEGSMKDPVHELTLRGQKGFEHLEEPRHIILTTTHPNSEKVAREKLQLATEKIGAIINHDHCCNDKHKREQLAQLAVIKGTAVLPPPPPPRASCPPSLLSLPPIFRPPTVFPHSAARRHPEQPQLNREVILSKKIEIPSERAREKLQRAAEKIEAIINCHLCNDKQKRKQLAFIKGTAVSPPPPPPRASSRPHSAARRHPEQPLLNREVILAHKIEIPSEGRSGSIGRILGHYGTIVQSLEVATGCRIRIRGKGSFKDRSLEMFLRGRKGYEHLAEPLHVLITATHPNSERIARDKLRAAAEEIKALINNHERGRNNEQNRQNTPSTP